MEVMVCVIRAPEVAEPPPAAAEAERDAPPFRAPNPPLEAIVVSGAAGEVVAGVADVAGVVVVVDVVSHVGTGGAPTSVVVVVVVDVDVVVEVVSLGAVSTGAVSSG